MKIDTIETIFAKYDRRGFLYMRENLCRMDGLLACILQAGSMADFKVLFARMKSLARNIRYPMHRLNDYNYEALLDIRWLSQLGLPHLLWLFENLLIRHSLGRKTGLNTMLPDLRVDAGIRAMFCHAIFDTVSGHESERMLFWRYGRATSESLKEFRGDSDYNAVRRISVSPRINFHVPFKVLEMIVDDKCSLFELNRQFEGRRICDSMLECFIHSTAVQCFTYHLSHYPKQVFKLRSPEEWLFTVCRCAKEKLAIAAVDEIERQLPGIVASARDPWGNTLLWNTFVNENPTEGLREELIRLGCDPNTKNEWGLSYQLLKDNDPEELLKHEEEVPHAV